MAVNDTIAAISTAHGRAAIGIVRLSGPGPTIQGIVEQLIGRSLPPRSAILADFLGHNGSVIDQGLALYFPAPHSYTGQDVLELQGHGGPVILQILLKRCLDLGARLAEPGEFTQRAFLNDKLDLAQAEGVADLIDAATAEAARCALRSVHGKFSEEIQRLKSQLVELRALVEATLDFPEEEIDFLTGSNAQERLRLLQQTLARIVDASRQGSLLREGIDIVLAGRPNVGKSSLLNCMTGEDSAIVTDVPGTTRDVIRQIIDIAGVPAHIIDTAGLRESSDPVEKIGVARTWAAIEKADLVVFLLDATKGQGSEDAQVLSRLPPGLPTIWVMNKIDLIPREPKTEFRDDTTVVWLSAKTGAGVDLLRQSILSTVHWHSTGESTFLARERHLRSLGEARDHLERAAELGQRAELFAEELRLAQEALSRITGEFTADDLLGEIFSRFCIGK